MQRRSMALRDEVVDAYSSLHRNVLGHSGLDIKEAEWDDLVILAGCRYDLVNAVNTIDGIPSTVVSKGSSTPELLEENFVSSTFLDSVLVAAILMVEERGTGEHFLDMIGTWRTDWAAEPPTVPPVPIAERVLEAAETYPNNRLIAQYLQPHYPFVGPTGRGLPHPTVTGPGVPDHGAEDTTYVGGQDVSGELDSGIIWQAYRGNPELVLPSGDRLMNHLPGKTVVTSDHGNGFGERGVFGHPTDRRLYLPSLVRGPWLVIEGEERKAIT